MTGLTLALTMLLLQGSPPGQDRKATLTGNIEKIDGFESAILKNRRNLIIYLPPQYRTEPQRRFPVLYMHDGQNVFDGRTTYIPNQEWRADESAEMLGAAGLVQPLIIVGIDNAGAERGNEYLPTNDPKNGYGGKADQYAEMLITELKPMIDRRYRTRRGPNDTGLAGASFGGIATLYIGLRHPNVFGRLGVFSPSLWWGAGELNRQLEAIPKRVPLKIWLDMGAQESGDNAGDNQLMLSYARRAAKALADKGWRSGRDFAYVEEGFANHSETAWARRFGEMLMFLFPA